MWRASTLALVLLARMFLGIVLGLVVWSLLPLAIQWQPTVVMSGSMAPRIMPGDVLVAQPLNVDEVDEEVLQRGQVPLAEDPSNPERLLTHRVVGYSEDGYITQGDANLNADSTPIPAENIRGIERLRIPFIGLPVQGIRTGNWVPAIVFALITIGAQLVVSLDRKVEGRGRRSRSGVDDRDHDGDIGSGAPDEADSADDSFASTSVDAKVFVDAAESRRFSFRFSEPTARRRAVAVAPALGVLLSGLIIAGSSASFSTSTLNSGNIIATNADIGPSDYRTSVTNDAPWALYDLDDPAGSLVAADSSGKTRNGDYTATGVTYGQPGALARETNHAMKLSGSSSGGMYAPGTVTNPTVYSIELWFKTTSNTGGILANFGSSATGLSSRQDRAIYMGTDGRLRFGTYVGGTDAYRVAQSTAGYNDGSWHHVMATMNTATTNPGMKLYADGIEVGSNVNTVSQNFTGYWRIGGDNLGQGAWPGSTGSSNYFTGLIDEAAVYTSAISGARVKVHYDTASAATGPTYSRAVLSDTPSFYYRFEEGSGPTAYDAKNIKHALYGTGGVTHLLEGALTSRNNSAIAFDETSGSMSTPNVGVRPDTFTTEVWLRTTTTSGGWIMGLGDRPTGDSTERDRAVYMTDAGGLVFGVYRDELSPKYRTIATPQGEAYNDGLWHLVTATLSGAGMQLYVDGYRVAADATITKGQAGAEGYWRLGYDKLSSWPEGPMTSQFEGSLDQFAVYQTALSPTQILARYRAA